MSAQPVQTREASSPGRPSPVPTVPPAPAPVEVRRRAGVDAVIALAASGIAIAYLGRAVGSGSVADWAFFGLLAAIAGVYLAGLLDARTPLLVADELGVRIRLGRQWRGLPWEAVDAVAVSPRRGLRDGRLGVSLQNVARAIEGLDSRAGRQAAANRRRYGVPLAVPLGITTRVVGGEAGLAQRVEALCAGRTAVVSMLATDDEERPRAAQSGVGTAPGPATGELGAAEQVLPRLRGGLGQVVSRCVGGRSHDVDAVAGDGTDLAGASAAPDELRTEGVEAGELDGVLPAPAQPLEGVSLLRGGPATGSDAVGSSRTDPRVTAIARLREPVEPLVVEHHAAEPAYDPVIGPELAAARVRVGLTVDELASRTRIRPHVIESIEVDDFGPCGGDFYARGHIRTLARVLGKDAPVLLDQFETRYAGAPLSARRVFEAELATGMTGSMRSTVGGPRWGLLVGSVVALALVWSVVRLFGGAADLAETPLPVVNGSTGSGSAFGEELALPVVRPLATTVAAVNAGTRVRVEDGDGTVVFEGDLALGDSLTLNIDPPVRVSSDNGGAVTVAVEGRDQGFLGQPDAAAVRTFTRPGR